MFCQIHLSALSVAAVWRREESGGTASCSVKAVRRRPEQAGCSTRRHGPATARHSESQLAGHSYIFCLNILSYRSQA